MKNIIKSLMLLSAISLFFASGAFAYPVSTGDTIQILRSPYGWTGGGEFRIIEGGDFKFNTFCLEMNEGVTPGDSYTILSITNAAEAGGVGGIVPLPPGSMYATGDPLSDQTKWLYFHYVLGDLDTMGTGYTYNSNSGANALQRAIWKLEDEIGTTSDSLADDLIAKANAAVLAGEGFGDVAALNLVTITSEGKIINRQDLLVATVPEPGTMLLFGAGLLGLVVYSKRRMSKSV